MSDSQSDLSDQEECHQEETWSDFEDDACGPVQCLFCPSLDATVDASLKHMRGQHAFDLAQVRTELKLNFYQSIRLINFIRSTNVRLLPNVAK
jgi:protein arginine N-methyltransferase 3